MKTSYYQSKLLDKARHLVVQTSIGDPRFGIWPEWEMDSIKPPAAILGMPLADYEAAYVAHLESIGVEAIKAELAELEAEAAKTGREVVLCCFESLKAQGQFCHRRIFAEWWQRMTGEDIAELTKGQHQGRFDL